MKKLSEALPHIKIKSDQEVQSENISNTHLRGLINADGMTSTTQRGRNSLSTSEQCKPLDLIKGNLDHERKLTSLLLMCFNTLNTYGKEPEQLEDANRVFIDILSEYSITDVRAAFKSYVTRNKAMPTPADIIELIPKPPTNNGLTDAQYKRLKQLRERNNLN